MIETSPNYEIILHGEEETLQCGASMASVVTAPCTIFLHGELGAGKTTFVRGFLHALGVTGRVKSPTYTLVECYDLADGSTVCHFDFYRIKELAELQHVGLKDYFTPNAICLIEWPEKATGYLAAPDLDCYLQYLDDARLLRVHANSTIGERLLAAMVA